jgi:hypothetical protein
MLLSIHSDMKAKWVDVKAVISCSLVGVLGEPPASMNSCSVMLCIVKALIESNS